MDKVKIGFPIEYEDGNNIIRNGLFLRELEIKELEKRLKEITNLKQQVKKQKEVINKIEKYCYKFGECTPRLSEVIDMLKEVSE